MTKRKSNPFDFARQYLARASKEKARAYNRARKQKIKAQQKEIVRDTVAKARALKKLGLYNPKNPIKQSNVTKATKKRINTLFVNLQKHNHYNANTGRTIRPLNLAEKTTKTGKLVPYYRLDSHFHLVKTKRKIKTGQLNTVKTSKGILVEKENAAMKVRVENDGTITEYLPGTKKRIRRKSYSGPELLQFIDDIKEGKIKLSQREYITLDRWGWGTPDAMGDEYASNELDSLAALFDDYTAKMHPSTFSAFINKSEVTIRRY